MSAPTRVQVRVLRAVNSQAVEIRRLVLATQGQEPARHARERASRHALDTEALAQTQLDAAAIAAGIPPEWIAQVRERGQLGMEWARGIAWREHEPVDRVLLVENLSADVRQLQQIAAVAAAYGPRGARAEIGTHQMVSKTMHALGGRIAAIAHILDVTTEEAQQLWGRQEAWVQAADSVRGVDQAALTQRWRQSARLNTNTAALQVAALQRAGIKIPQARNPAPTVPEMLHRFRDLLTEPTTAGPEGTVPDPARSANPVREPDRKVRFSDPGGHQITESVAAAGLSFEELRPVFRSAADSEASPEIGPVETGYEP